MAEYYPGPPPSEKTSLKNDHLNSDLWNTIPTSFEKKNKKYDELITKINEILAKPSIETDDRIQLSEYNIQLRTLRKNTSAYMTEKSSRFRKFPIIETQFNTLIEKIESTLKRISEKIDPIEEKKEDNSRKYVHLPKNDPPNSIRSPNMAYLYKKGSPLDIIYEKIIRLRRKGKDTTFYTKLFEKLLYEQQLNLNDLLLLSREGVDVNRNLKDFAEDKGHIFAEDKGNIFAEDKGHIIRYKNNCENCNMTLYDASQHPCPKKITENINNNYIHV